MAYVPSQIPKSQQNLFGRDDETTPNPLPPQTGGSSGSTPVGGGTNAAPGVGTSTQFGSSAAKLSDYLTANEGQIGEFAGKLAGNLTEGFNKARGAIDQGYGDFQNQVNQGFNRPDQSKIDQALSNPVSYAQDPNNVSQFQGWYNNEYKGPQNFESSETYGNLNSQVNKAVDNSNLIGSFSGLGTFLSNTTDQQGQTPGMKTLDTALLMRNPGAWNTIKDAAAPAKGLSDYLGSKTQSADQAATTARTTTDQSRQSLQDKFTGQNGFIPQLDQRIQKAASDALQNRNAYNLSRTELQQRAPQLKSMFPRAPLPPGLMGTADLTPLESFDPSSAAIIDSPTAGSVASPDDYAYEAALEKLTGQNLGILNNDEAGQAGSFKIPKEVYDKQNSLNGIVLNDTRTGLYNDLAAEAKRLGVDPKGKTGEQILQSLQGQNLSSSLKLKLDQLVNLGVLQTSDQGYGERRYQ